ncbi:hypothetical protein ACWA16_12040 [Bacillus subtilis]|uniref:hypothetical protein n=1 Tax=Bacillus subtilis TaxID=1423 RepID=UPI0015601FFE|nr:hypothetical protein [Bacillus subtilis]NRF01934.1 hypothetical protein [Bacillus subtilis]NRG37160.1 hypothetical protein [Bacillus subtilis]UHH05329.1 hypothetical protein LUM37_10395 [Bacillus subtilis]
MFIYCIPLMSQSMIPMAFDKTIHVMKVTGMFAATYFTGVTASVFAFMICLKSFKLENMDQPPKNKSNIFPAVEDSLL